MRNLGTSLRISKIYGFTDLKPVSMTYKPAVRSPEQPLANTESNWVQCTLDLSALNYRPIRKTAVNDVVPNCCFLNYRLIYILASAAVHLLCGETFDYLPGNGC